ncbi:Similar to RF_0381: Putative ankyrin repeat protein RF_0381 (Rickettsia felis (strain ATCC VR-1525 / URRWXCal2)) [Cotesia congregata]|uniref:Similar to RF_0381: Putative ankyrin repeat protein RF_0381 (Rickettsia felis (Strain ATCC VR-1525 / URRWXCal2)) n=1 Tax=Cotesia congregata TaxID=51543 RepID=A0A8J2H9L9_COTCN|nr:Similar to RF_0381: Putative ankyrin repeat protein RF_0381 (Rickettsia felis (strain ATCC VR-1525 / URRWXCal2)) [Cotesia congregata]
MHLPPSKWLIYMDVPKLSSKAINVTVVKELLNQPKSIVDMPIFETDRGFLHYTTFLCMAVRNRDEKLIDYLIHRGANVNESSADKDETPVFIAAKNGDTKVFKKFYHLGAYIDSRPLWDLPPFLMAAHCGHFEIIKYLIQQGFDVNKTDPDYGTSLLHHAAASPNTELVEFLLDNNAEIDAKSVKGETPLVYAILHGRISTAKLLLARGAGIYSVRSSISESTLMHDVHNKQFYLKNLLSLDEPETDINILNKAGQTILHYKYSTGCRGENSYIILDAGVDVNARDSEGQLAINCIQTDGENTDRFVVKSHIIKLLLAGLTVCEGNRQAIKESLDENQQVIKFYQKDNVLKELEEMKVNKIGVSNITFFNALHMSFHYLAIRLKFAGLDQVISEKKLKTVYPFYGGMLFYKLSKVRRRIKYLEEVEKCVEGILWDLGLPSTFIRELWSYFNNIELNKLMMHKNDNFIRFL